MNLQSWILYLTLSMEGIFFEVRKYKLILKFTFCTIINVFSLSYFIATVSWKINWFKWVDLMEDVFCSRDIYYYFIINFHQ